MRENMSQHTYELRYGGTGVVHITGLPEVTKTSSDGMTYAQSACPALSRGDFLRKTIRMDTHTDLRRALKYVETMCVTVKLCKRCETAARRVIDNQPSVSRSCVKHR